MILSSSSLPRRSEHDDFVETIEKLRRELSTRCFDASARASLTVSAGTRLLSSRGRNMETELRTDERTHFRSAGIACQKNQRVRKVHFAVIAQRQRGLVQDSEERIPKASLAFSISSNSTKLSFTASVWY